MQTFHDVMRRLAVKEVERRHEEALRNAAAQSHEAISELSDTAVDSWTRQCDLEYRPLAIQGLLASDQREGK